MLMTATFINCSSKNDPIEKEDPGGIAEYHLSIWDQNLDWTDDGTNKDADFRLDQADTGQKGVFALTVRMGQEAK